jgi:hypothetical protein
MRPAEAGTSFNQIDFLHLDERNSSELILADVDSWLKNVREGGFICLSGCLNPVVQRACEVVGKQCDLVKTIDKGDSLIFRKIK